MFAVFILALFVCLQQRSGYPHSPFPVCREYYRLFVLSAKHRVPWLFMWSQSGCHEYLKGLWLSVSTCCMCDCCCTPLPDRNEVTKLKFEGKTFHVYANQKEVRAWIVGCGKIQRVVLCVSLLYFPARFFHFQRAGWKDHLDVLCTHTGGMQAPLEVWSGEPSVLQVSPWLSSFI